MTTTEQKQKQEMVLPSFFYAIASSESRQLISLDELQRIITLDAMTQARTEDYRKNMRISSELAHQTKVMMPGITTSVLMDGRGKELRNVVKTTQMIAVDIDKIPAEKMKEVVQKADADPHTMMRFITVSQRGLRIISRYLPIDDDEVTALELFDVIIRKAMSYYSKLLGVPADEQCVDITRMCGLAHDPTAYFHWDAEPFGLDTHDLKALYTKKANEAKYAKRASKRKRNSQKMVALGKGVPSMDEAAQHILNLLDTWGYKFESGAHNEYVLHFGKVCVRYGIDKEEAMTYAKSNFSSDYPDADSVMKSCYKHTEKLGTWHFYRKGEGFSGKPTVKVIKQWLSMRYEFHHNEVTGFHEVLSRDIINGKYHKWTRIDDNIENTIWTQMDEMGLEVSAIKLHAIINSDFSEPWDPFDEYLRSLPKWDGKTDYIDELANRVTINYCPGYHHSQEEFRYFFKKWLVSMVVAWVSPRVVSQTILIFIGRGGINKTTFFYYILPPCLRQYFINESTANYTDKDFMEAFSSKALICLDELESTFGKGLSALKSNVTKLVFSIRRPYDKYRSELLHRGALCGTSNSIQIITDEENRRYSPWFVDNIESPRETPHRLPARLCPGCSSGTRGNQSGEEPGRGMGILAHHRRHRRDEGAQRHVHGFQLHGRPDTALLQGAEIRHRPSICKVPLFIGNHGAHRRKSRPEPQHESPESERRDAATGIQEGTPRQRQRMARDREESGRNQHRGDLQSKRMRRNVPETVQSRSYG